MKTATHTDHLGNTARITTDGTKVRLSNQHRIAKGLSSLQHHLPEAKQREIMPGGRRAAETAVKEAVQAAAAKGGDFAANMRAAFPGSNFKA